MPSRLSGSAALICLLVSLSACTSYYRVTDPASGREYYTHDVDRHGSTVRFEDAQTGTDVTLQSSEVNEISKNEFRSATVSK